jgi:hypothetical protein
LRWGGGADEDSRVDDLEDARAFVCYLDAALPIVSLYTASLGRRGRRRRARRRALTSGQDSRVPEGNILRVHVEVFVSTAYFYMGSGGLENR